LNKLVTKILRKEYLESLPVSLQKQIPILFYGDIILFFYFSTGALVRYFQSPQDSLLFLITVVPTSFSFIGSIIFLSMGKHTAAFYLASIALWLNPTWVGLLLPAEGIISIY